MSRRRCFLGLAGVLGALCLSPPLAAQSVSEDLEGTLGSQPVSARLRLSGRRLEGTLNFIQTGEQLNLAGELFADPLTEGLTTCGFGPDASNRSRKHGLGLLGGFCELGERDGAATLSFEGFWRGRRREEP